MACVCDSSAYKDKQKTMSDVKYVYLFFKVNKCYVMVAHGELAGCPVSQSVNLLTLDLFLSRGCGLMS